MDSVVNNVLKRKYGFDLYGRHYITQQIAHFLKERSQLQTLSILDAGGSTKILKEFLPEENISVLDPLVEDEPEKNIFHGDATNMKGIFKDESFDLVVSHDVFEHIKPNQRIAFVKESLRVAKDIVVIAAPFNRDSVVEAEKNVNKFFKNIHGIDHPWLKEHFENGLPSELDIESYLIDRGVEFVKLSNNIIKLWKLSFYLTFLIEANLDADREHLLEEFKYFYNEHISPADFGTDSYRQVYVISKKGFDEELKSKILQLNDSNVHSTVSNDYLLEYYFSVLSDILKNSKLLRDKVINNLNNEINTLKASEQAKTSHLLAGNEEAEDFKQKVKDLSASIESKEKHIKNLEKVIGTKNQQIQELELKISSSKVLKIARLLRKIRKLFSPTGARYIIRLVKKVIFILRYLGFKEFTRYVKRYIRKHFLLREDSTPDTYEYALWLRNNTPSIEEYERIKQEASNFTYQPKISICMPVYNVEERWLRLAINSVLNQIYENWELCIVDDASTQKHIKPLLEKYSQKDARINVVYSPVNQHISLATNKAFEIATGEFVSLMDNDDEIPPNALFEFVKVLNKNPELDLIFSDEDQLDMDGQRCNPLFKPDWAPNTILSMMYTTHLSIYRRALALKIGGMRQGYEGSQDYDFVLRFTEQTTSDRICHIPKVLYHWRRIPGSTAESYTAKPYAQIAAKKALEDTLIRRNIKGKILNGLTPPSFRLKREIIGDPKVSIIIPTYNRQDLVKVCIESIKEKSSYNNYEILLIDNNSNDPESLQYFEKLKEDPVIKVLKYNKPFNFSAINNFGAAHASGDHLLFLNNDTEVINQDWIEAMLEYSQLPEIGAVGAKLLYPNDTIQHAGVILGIGGVAGHSHKDAQRSDSGYMGRILVAQDLTAVTAACMMVKKSLFLEVGGFNEKDLSVAFNDVDFCLKIYDRGYRNIYTPFAELYHYESVSRGYEDTPEKIARFEREANYMLKHWHKYLKSDPNYNPNLTLEKQDFSINLDTVNQ